MAFRKNGTWYADWIAIDGRRRRRRANSKALAERLQHEQQALVHAERCATALDLSVHHTFRHKAARADAAKKAVAIINAPASERPISA
jgi:hypothetical protein